LAGNGKENRGIFPGRACLVQALFFRNGRNPKTAP
jgi:hypothetical protein